MSVGVHNNADTALADATSTESPIETLRRRLYDLKWHVPRDATRTATATLWLSELVTAAEQCSCDDVQAAAQAEEGQAAALVRFLKSDDEEVTELASRAITSLSGQGTYRTTITVDKIDVNITQRGFAGSGDTLGNQVWPSALRLSKLCCNAKEGLVNKKVVELGCGPGLPGIVCCHLGAAAVVLTDFEDAVLDIARANVKANPFSAGIASVQRLDWDVQVEEFVQTHGTFDVVLAADCVYNEEHAAAVAKVIALLLVDGGDGVAVVVLGDRKGRRGVELFEAAVVSLGLVVRRKQVGSEQSEWVLRRHKPRDLEAFDPWVTDSP
eukprot:m.465053 g.465053  ORF g.465053 m.465053 type:complete len:325 (-) comp23949_c0_seq1:65-1039(-)